MSNVANTTKKFVLTGWEGFWYVLQCIAFGAGYFTKVPAKKALQDFGLVQMTTWEQFWYVLQCIAFGAGYFAKIPTAKALSELPQYQSQRIASLGTLGVGLASPATLGEQPLPPPPVQMPQTQQQPPELP